MSIGILAGIISCEEPEIDPGFEDQEQMTIYDYISDHEDSYSSFMKILNAGGIAKTLSAYNPDGIGYTLFLPDNRAIDEFIQESDAFNSLDELLADNTYASAFAKYHVVNLGIETNDFPFGALPEFTLSFDYLTVSFVIETDTSYYKINNQAPVVIPNIELSNGYIHGISKALVPVTLTTYGWLAEHEGFSIFTSAAELTGVHSAINSNLKEIDNEETPKTLLVEPDTVMNRHGIYTLEDLIQKISPENSNYTDPQNPLYNFVAYHILEGNRFLDDFVGANSNYSTYSETPIRINGTGLDIFINKGKQVFDTLINGTDTTIVDYVGFYYDESNVITQSGSIHFIDQLLERQIPTRATQTYEFYEEPLFNELRQETGTFLIDDSSALYHIRYSGADLFFVEYGDEEISAWGNDYIQLNGDFVIKYTIPKIIQGKYDVFLGAEAFSGANAVVEVFIDGKNLGGLIDLSSGGSSSNPFTRIELGTIDFVKYESHVIEVRSLIPGRFLWDYIRFEPFKN